MVKDDSQTELNFDRWLNPERYQPSKSIKPIYAPKQDQPRLTGHNAAICEALVKGPKTNEQLSKISLKYTSRISDLRAAGYKIEAERIDGGLFLYRLTGFPNTERN